MFRKSSLSILSILLLASSSQAGLQEDFELKITPWVNAAYSAKPLLDLVVADFYWLEKNLIGFDPKSINTVYQSSDQQLVSSEQGSRTENARNCFKNARALLQLATDKFTSDGICFKARQDEFYRITEGLIAALFPSAPTPACPLPLICKMDLVNFKMRNFSKTLTALKDLRDNLLRGVKFLVYFYADITKCRQNIQPYKTVATLVLTLSRACSKL